jgi:hypothetical protein
VCVACARARVSGARVGQGLGLRAGTREGGVRRARAGCGAGVPAQARGRGAAAATAAKLPPSKRAPPQRCGLMCPECRSLLQEAHHGSHAPSPWAPPCRRPPPAAPPAPRRRPRRPPSRLDGRPDDARGEILASREGPPVVPIGFGARHFTRDFSSRTACPAARLGRHAAPAQQPQQP